MLNFDANYVLCALYLSCMNNHGALYSVQLCFSKAWLNAAFHIFYNVDIRNSINVKIVELKNNHRIALNNVVVKIAILEMLQ